MPLSDEDKELLDDPKDYCCPISLELMENPTSLSDDFTYENVTAQNLLANPNTKSPKNPNVTLDSNVHRPNKTLKSIIETYRDEKIKKINIRIISTLKKIDDEPWAGKAEILQTIPQFLEKMSELRPDSAHVKDLSLNHLTACLVIFEGETKNALQFEEDVQITSRLFEIRSLSNQTFDKDDEKRLKLLYSRFIFIHHAIDEAILKKDDGRKEQLKKD